MVYVIAAERRQNAGPRAPSGWTIKKMNVEKMEMLLTKKKEGGIMETQELSAEESADWLGRWLKKAFYGAIPKISTTTTGRRPVY